jgi:hypothetical protein
MIPVLAVSVTAQDDTGTTPTQTTGPSVNYFIVICDNRAVVNFSGTMFVGYDIFYQVFSGPNGTGNPLTALRQVPVSGEYAFSEVVNYLNGATVAAGATASARVRIARETNPDSATLDQTVNDVQDGCAEPQNQSGSSVDLGSSDPGQTDAQGQVVLARPNTILSPFGGFLNPDYTPTRPPLVVIGARDLTPPRQGTPGLIFAECNNYPVANPGLIYDTDRITVFWSWFARTPELVQEHIDAANYAVGYFGSNPFIPPVQVSEIQQIGRNYWVFYTVDLGFAAPDNYSISFRLTWDRPISDGYEDFGPGTANEQIISGCAFQVRPNPTGQMINYSFP